MTCRLFALALLCGAAACVSPDEDVGEVRAGLTEAAPGTRGGATLAVGDVHVCVITKTGGVRCWGRNSYGQLGDGTTSQRLSPVTVVGLSSVVGLTAGSHHTCAALADGTARCWGRNHNGQLGDGTTTQRTTPVAVGGLDSVAKIAAGRAHTCAVRAHGDARCWGRGTDGQLGQGSYTSSSVPVTVSTWNEWKQVVPGSDHTCGVRGNGAVYCWGSNAHGQLGLGSAPGRNTPGHVVALVDVRQIASGASHGCALREGGTVSCWGLNDYGQLGDGTVTTRAAPVSVPGLSEVASLAAGGKHTCALRTEEGQGRCWGLNQVGQVGTASPVAVLSPRTVESFQAIEIEVGGGADDGYMGTSCAVKATGEVVCWGFGNYGQMGNGGQTLANVDPVTASVGSQLRGSVSIATGQWNEVLVVRPDGANHATSWFPGTTPQPTGPMWTTPRMVGSNYTQSCALLADGTMQCWGENDYGAVGDGTFEYREDPVDVAGWLDFKAVHFDTGTFHTCAVLTDGTVRCWGAGGGYQLGNGGTSTFPTPQSVLGLEDASIQVSTGGSTSCALLVDGRVSCWGYGSPYTSTGSAGNPHKPTAGLTDPLGVTAVALSGGSAAAADSHCALLASGQVKCWGMVPGDGSSFSVSPQTVLLGTRRAVAVDTCGTHSCAVMADGKVRCWGYNFDGQLGIGSATSPIWVPVEVAGLSNAIAVSTACYTGDSYTCAVRADGRVYCWGTPFGMTPTYQLTL